MPKKTKLPAEVVEHWPEVFKDIEVEAVPIDYLDSIVVSFVDGEVWDIDLSKNPKDVSVDEVLSEMLYEYEGSIANVDFRINTKKVKDDITKRTKYFLKKRK